MRPTRDRFVTLCQQFLVLGTLLAVAAPAASIVSLNIVAPAPGSLPTADGFPQATGALVASHPVEPEVRKYPIAGVDRSALQSLMRSSGSQRIAPESLAALSDPEPVSGYATVGVTWKHGVKLDDEEITVSVRTRDNGTWSDWTDAEYDADHGPDPDSEEGRNARPGTDALLVGQVDEVQVKAVTDSGEAPPDLQLSVIDPGQTPGDSVEQPAIDTARLASASTVDSPLPEVPETDPVTETTTVPGETETETTVPDETVALAGGVTPKPRIFSRGQWGADERLRDRSSLQFYEVHAGFVHHTVNTNDYTRAQVPSLMRGIYAYHTQSRGWSDIGYNYIVDRFGRIWEGRYGGVDRPVVGAHTLGYNEYSFAMSALGNYETKRPSRAMLRAYGKLFAWKLSLHGVDASSTRQWVGSKYFQAINGHRDAGQTACPGRYLYARLPRIRRLTIQYQSDFSSRDRTADLAGSPLPDLVAREAGTKRAFVIRTAGQVGFEPAQNVVDGWGDRDLVTMARDLTGDGHTDLVARTASTGVAAIYPGDGAGGFGDPIRPSKRFAGMNQLAGVGDLNGDGHADLVARAEQTGRLFLYRGNGNAGLGKRRVLAGDWTGYNLTTGAGDLNGDGHADLVARDKAGTLWLIPGTGRIALGTPVAMPYTWGSFDLITGYGDFTGDGQPDLLARKRRSQKTFIYPTDGSGGFKHRYGPFTEFRGMDFLSGAGQLAGNGRPDVVGLEGSRLVVVPHSGGQNIGQIRNTGAVFGNTNLILNVGDWNGDGRGDVMTRSAKGGRMLFRAGLPRNKLAPPVVAGTGWRGVRLLTAVGDMTGDGLPDLLGQPAGSSMRIYPGDGESGFKYSYVAHSAIGATAQVGVGLWDDNGAPDSVLRANNGTLVLFPGNGPGGLMNGRKVGGGANRYDFMVGAGDVNGDGHPDIVARTRTGGDLWLLPGNGSTFGRRQFIAEGFGRFDLLG